MKNTPTQPPRLPALAQNYGMLASPPPLQVVVARAFISCALAMRAQLEQHDDKAAVDAMLRQCTAWLNEHGFARLLSDEEAAALSCEPGTLDRALAQRYAQLGEAAAVLAWALRRASLPAPDDFVDAADIAASLGFLTDPGAALTTTARLRDREETASYADIAGALHWRIQRQMTEPGDLLMRHWRSDQLAWPQDVTPASFVDDDLALGGRAVSTVPDPQLLPWLLVAAERHRASLWLLGQQRDYWQIAAQVS